MATEPKSPLHSVSSPWTEFEPSVRLNDLKLFVEIGLAPAIYDAWVLITDFDLDTPQWLSIPTRTLVGKKLRHKSVPYRRAMKHYYRWRTVKEVKEEGIFGDIYEEAQRRLLGTDYYAAPTTIEGSYDKVERELKDPKKAFYNITLR